MEKEARIQLLAPFLVHYQPIVSLEDHQMVGCEALARWPSGGEMLGPGHFIEGIEGDLSLALDLTEQVLSRVRSDMGEFLFDTPDFYVSTNIPAILLGNGRLERILDNAGLNGLITRIVLEVTERHSPDESGRTALRAARALGARVALDDFGTGRSGFQELLLMDIDILKIDRSLVIPLNHDVLPERLVRGLAMFATILGVKLVAEGVESREQAAFLRAAGVHCGQGWLWSKALPPEELIRVQKSGVPLLAS